jgi:hypothetical protein
VRLGRMDCVLLASPVSHHQSSAALLSKGCANPQLHEIGTWDLITSITFSRPYGYMSKGVDFDGTIANLDKTID